MVFFVLKIKPFASNLSYLPVWIRIRIRNTDPIHKVAEYGSNLNPDLQIWAPMLCSGSPTSCFHPFTQ